MENIQNELEFKGRTVEEAVKKAISILKVSKKNLRIKVVAEEQKGLFGMDGAKPAKILVSVLSKATKKKA
jgi:spoIIIJ-associated protein